MSQREYNLPLPNFWKIGVVLLQILNIYCQAIKSATSKFKEKMPCLATKTKTYILEAVRVCVSYINIHMIDNS